MKRRDFIKKSVLAGQVVLLPKLFRGLDSSLLIDESTRKLVIIQLAGGNDGLNTIIPYRNDLYYSNRPGIAIPAADVLKVTDELGFNGNMEGMRKLYDQSYLSIINNVGYPEPNRSHFRSTDIWQTASDADEYLDTGWVGRYIDIHGKRPYAGIELDDSLSLIMKGSSVNGIATKDPKVLFRNARTPYFKKVHEYAGGEPLENKNLEYLYRTLSETELSARYIDEATRGYKSKLEYPENPFGRQLRTTAGFINSHLQTGVYFISMGGFDTHANQLRRQNNLLDMYSKAMDVFVRDLHQNDTFRDTLILTFSEFGRRVKQNAANGTDHGAANQVFVIGQNLKRPGFYNGPPDLSRLDNNGDLQYTVDFRSVYATLLNRWLKVDDRAILNGTFEKLQFI